MNLYHYYEKGTIPFRTLSDLSDVDATKVQNDLKEQDNVYTRRDYDGKYVEFRRTVEEHVREAFLAKDGKAERKNPVYAILGESHNRNPKSYTEWYRNPDYIEIPLDNINSNMVSFTYGDSFIENHPEHHDQNTYQERVYTYEEIKEEIAKRGWPQDSHTDDSPFWIPEYIEAQIWSDEVINQYRNCSNDIKKAEQKDAPIVAEIALKLWKNHSLEELTQEFNYLLHDNEAAVFIKYLYNKPIGFAQCQLRHDYVEGTSTSPVGYLEGIFIDKSHHHKGYASELLKACEEWAKSMNCTEFASDCELTNTDSLAFHKHMGFDEANRIICFTKHL